MQATFSFAVDPILHLMQVTMAGFYEPDDIARFAIERAQAHRLLPCGLNEHLTLVDIRGMRIQSQTSVELFGK
ncbi:MAG: hypothetical protein EOO77_44370, partial [Oxalobacteraceae bacterium]